MTVEQWLGENNKIGIDIWHKKYQYDNETFDEWVTRVSGHNPEVAELIYKKQFLFGGRILANRGIPQDDAKLTLSNCYVITPPEDTLESIFETASKLARTYSYGGGCGVDIGKLRPEGAKVHNAAKTSTGAVSFMELFNTTTGVIGQAGRRGALMISIPVEHPDVEKFITIKGNAERLTNANISIRVSDAFMSAVANNADWDLTFDGKVYKTVRAKELFHKMCENNWNYAEPGILFWDTIENHTLLQYDKDFEFAGTNPCAEEPLPAGGSCLLGSLNLAAFVNKTGEFNIEAFRHAVYVAIKGLNEVLLEGKPLHPLQEQRESVDNWRQIGLGIFGFADMLIKMKVTYGSQEALAIINEIGQCMFKQGVQTSEDLAYFQGSYPMFAKESINRSDMLKQAKISVEQLANSQLFTIAPTGTLSTMLGVSGGIEPIFANSYTRKTQSLHGHDEYYKIYTPIVKEYMEQHNLKDDTNLPEYFITAPQINSTERIAVQGAWQKWIDASISSTINLPNEATVEDIENIYLSAWKYGLKGVTIYRAGCAREGVLVATSPKKSKKNQAFTLAWGDILAVDDNVIGLKRKLQTGCGNLHVQAYFDPNNGTLQEVYLSKGSTGGCNSFMIGLSRMISLAARAGVDIEDIVDQLNSTPPCTSYVGRSLTKKDTSPGSCCPIAVGKALMSMSQEIQDCLWNNNGYLRYKEPPPPKKTRINKCPHCGEELIQENGCITCKACGWSKCD